MNWHVDEAHLSPVLGRSHGHRSRDREENRPAAPSFRSVNTVLAAPSFSSVNTVLAAPSFSSVNTVLAAPSRNPVTTADRIDHQELPALGLC
jgi:hypothetical protein